MFIKLHLHFSGYKVFQAEDIISIDPVIGIDGVINTYHIRLSDNSHDLVITHEQAHDLSIALNAKDIPHPRQYQ